MNELVHIKEMARITRIQVTLGDLNAKLAGLAIGLALGALLHDSPLAWIAVAALVFSLGGITWFGIWVCRRRIRELNANLEALGEKSEVGGP